MDSHSLRSLLIRLGASQNLLDREGSLSAIRDKYLMLLDDIFPDVAVEESESPVGLLSWQSGPSIQTSYGDCNGLAHESVVQTRGNGGE